MNAHIQISSDFHEIESDLRQLSKLIANQGQTPFAGGDSSVGMEYELQVAVEGCQKDVDLPMAVCASTYYKNVLKRTARGDLPTECLDLLQDFLDHNESRVWENSWVRFPEERLTSFTRRVLARDFLADKKSPASRPRSDIHRFRCLHKGREHLRLPVSYLLKLALANAISSDSQLPPDLFATGTSLMENLLSDNTSPEILSFTIPVATRGRIGDLAAAESARTMLFSQLLVQYANKTFGLEASGQKCLLYSAPHAPSRQKLLNALVPDDFYRRLFISPCLSGWDRGEEKNRYMELCHKTLSRSQLNTIGKLKDAGIITNDLVVLPNTSTTCLANNGTHVSLGSQVLTAMAKDLHSPFSPTVEKYFGDLVIKIVEHFLPLFVGTYSADPYRIDFADFHPERVLGFLPHELDYTHLRMMWRRWQKKAGNRFFGKTVTPFGPRWLDSRLAKFLCLSGDLIPDFRLIDYLVTLLSTETSPGLNGMSGNHEKLKADLAEMGVFDARMSIYLPYRQRIWARAGYAGFEGRSYSLFPSLLEDMAEAVDLQNLVTALACRYVLEGKIHHHDIPDQPFIESERRQIFFGSAIGIPTFFVRADTANNLLRKIVADIPSQRVSRRYQGYIRIEQKDYNLALVRMLERDGADLIEQGNLKDRIDSLRTRLSGETATAFAGILAGVRQEIGAKSPARVPAADFNNGVERYYRTSLKTRHLNEGFSTLLEDCRRLQRLHDTHLEQTMLAVPGDLKPESYIERHRPAILAENADPAVLAQFIRMTLAVIHFERNSNIRP
ncbi:MAG TPA: hypothetical protein DDY32_07700 [Desulfobulbaceae bacterium]|nr:hypothetical protein [Desulfobulbaceae bacterium]